MAPIDPRTVSDPGVPVPLELRGALVLSAAQDVENALEVKTPPERTLRGAFTFALVEALSAGGDEPARRIFLRAERRMKAFTSQTPVLAGTSQRQGATLFESAPAKIGARVEVPVRRNGKQIEVDAGAALGLGVGSVLARRVEGSPELKLVLTSLEGATKAFARVSEGDPASLGDGGLFEVVEWAAMPGTNLIVHVPEGVDARVLESVHRGPRGAPQDRARRLD